MSSIFAQVASAPPDPILGLTEAFNADTHPNKVNLGVGVYQNEDGKVPVLRAYREAEQRWLASESTKSYLPIDGAPAFLAEVRKLLFGADAPVVAEDRVVSAQCLGGTGALKVGADLIRRHLPATTVWLSSPSWENHKALFEAAGFTVRSYAYYDPTTRGLDWEAMTRDLRAIPAGDVVLLHACCHNPTGVDLNAEQWAAVVRIAQERGHVPFLDFAYQGFAEGLEEDAHAVRRFADSGLSFLVASSFSKNFSVYRERVGALNIVTSDAEEAARVRSQVKRVIRTNYSNPPSHGAQVVALALGDPELRALWETEVARMRDRIRAMRTQFVAALRAQEAPRDFGFIEKQRGMFSFTGLDVDTVRKLRAEKSLYIVDSGRICMAALNERNLPYVCGAIAAALRS
jgi:aromatic-amino-acid transaminase